MKSYVYPGCGYGGYCLPKDTQAFIYQAGIKGYDAAMLKCVTDVNEKIKESIIKTISSSVPKDEAITVLGLSFKRGSDDVREAPSKNIIELLLKEGYSRITVYDPMACENFKMNITCL